MPLTDTSDKRTNKRTCLFVNLLFVSLMELDTFRRKHTQTTVATSAPPEKKRHSAAVFNFALSEHRRRSPLKIRRKVYARKNNFWKISRATGRGELNTLNIPPRPRRLTARKTFGCRVWFRSESEKTSRSAQSTGRQQNIRVIDVTSRSLPAGDNDKLVRPQWPDRTAGGHQSCGKSVHVRGYCRLTASEKTCARANSHVFRTPKKKKRHKNLKSYTRNFTRSVWPPIT